MTDRIANDMGQRFGDRVQQSLIEISVLAPYGQSTSLPQRLATSRITRGKAAEQLFDRNHADLHDRTLQIVEHSRLKAHGIAKRGRSASLG